MGRLTTAVVVIASLVVSVSLSCAHKSIRVVTPYFLPPDPLTMSLGLAALRGVKVDIVLPEHSNHTILDWARRVPLRPLIEAGCRVWLTPTPFDHSKLMVIDDAWALIGSANWDTRSFRLNFELNVELHDPDFACKIAAVVPATRRLTLAEIDGDRCRPLRSSAARLLQPYLYSGRDGAGGPGRSALLGRATGPQSPAFGSASSRGYWSDGPSQVGRAANRAPDSGRAETPTLLAKCVNRAADVAARQQDRPTML
jgi:hypothetical protein